MSNRTREFPVLFSIGKTGVVRQWSVGVITDEKTGQVRMQIRHGQKDGKMILEDRVIDQKNKRSQDLFEHAVRMAESRWNHKIQRERYGTSIDEQDRPPIAPMLCKTYEDGKHLSFPLYVQQKIDGIRCLAQWGKDGVQLRSRTGVVFQSPHLQAIRERLASYLEEYPLHVLDGELYASNIPFEELSGLCRLIETRQPIRSIQYLIFDTILLDDMNAGFQSRIGRLMFPDDDVVQIVPTHQCTSIDEIMEFHGSFVAAGYEGTIIRNRDGIYRMGYRSWDLQKYKTFMEEEFPIVGFTEGQGREKGTVIWQCTTPHGRTFHVRPRGSIEHRAAMFQEAQAYMGRPLTVIFQEYTSDGVPRFPVGKAVRVE